MREGNVRTRERFTLAIDGRQIAAVVVGALVVVGAAFALGMQVGQRLGARRAEAARPANVTGLEAVEGPPRATPGKELTFPAELPRAKPGPPPPPATARPSGGLEAAAPGPSPAPAPEPAAPVPTPAPAAAPTPAASAAATEPSSQPRPVSAATPTGGSGAWTVQFGATQRHEEAEVLAHKVKGLGPRIEEAEIPGKGRFYRVRAGHFESKEAAEKFRADAKRETGISGLTVAAGK